MTSYPFICNYVLSQILKWRISFWNQRIVVYLQAEQAYPIPSIFDAWTKNVQQCLRSNLMLYYIFLEILTHYLLNSQQLCKRKRLSKCLIERQYLDIQIELWRYNDSEDALEFQLDGTSYKRKTKCSLSYNLWSSFLDYGLFFCLISPQSAFAR
jgi:hypothetical protein